jgi:hypothetical protein
MNGMITIVAASDRKDLERKLDGIKRTHEQSNPHRKVVVEVLKPNPDEVEFRDWEATSFTVSVELHEDDDDNLD